MASFYLLVLFCSRTKFVLCKFAFISFFTYMNCLLDSSKFEEFHFYALIGTRIAVFGGNYSFVRPDTCFCEFQGCYLIQTNTKTVARNWSFKY